MNFIAFFDRKHIAWELIPIENATKIKERIKMVLLNNDGDVENTVVDDTTIQKIINDGAMYIHDIAIKYYSTDSYKLTIPEHSCDTKADAALSLSRFFGELHRQLQIKTEKKKLKRVK